MNVKIIGYTSPVEKDTPEYIIELAGKLCYGREPGFDSDPGKYVMARIHQGHTSLIEHVSITFLVTGISRACGNQLVRHRIASYSQESQRYSDATNIEFIVPDTIKSNVEATKIWEQYINCVRHTYLSLRMLGIPKEDARFALPSAASTKIVVTMNIRELRHFFSLRLRDDAQWEIRNLAREMLSQAYKIVPGALADLYNKYCI